MKQRVKYPDDKFLAVRPCVTAVCLGNRPAGKLLGALLYRYNLSSDDEIVDGTFRIFRTQSELVEDDMCGEISEKTLCDVAIPMLQLLGFLDVEQRMASNCYIVYVNQAQEALDLYIPKQKEQPQLEKFLISNLQLEKFLISSSEGAQLEKFLIDKKNFQLQLEKFLIQIRNISNQNGLKRGRKRASEATSSHMPKTPKNIKEDIKNNNKNITPVAASADNADSDKPSQRFLIDPAPAEQQEKTNKRAVATRNSKKVVDESPEQKERKRALKALINQYRGYDLSEKGPLVNENNCIIKLVEKYGDKDLFDALKYLVKRDWKYSKPDNCHTVGAQVLLKEIDRVLVQFRDDPQMRNEIDSPPPSKSSSNRAPTRQDRTENTTRAPTLPEASMSESDALGLASRAIELAKGKGHEIGAQVIPLADGAWAVSVEWNTAPFNRPCTIKSENLWVQQFGQICKIWDKQPQREVIYG